MALLLFASASALRSPLRIQARGPRKTTPTMVMDFGVLTTVSADAAAPTALLVAGHHFMARPSHHAAPAAEAKPSEIDVYRETFLRYAGYSIRLFRRAPVDEIHDKCRGPQRGVEGGDAVDLRLRARALVVEEERGVRRVDEAQRRPALHGRVRRVDEARQEALVLLRDGVPVVHVPERRVREVGDGPAQRVAEPAHAGVGDGRVQRRRQQDELVEPDELVRQAAPVVARRRGADDHRRVLVRL